MAGIAVRDMRQTAAVGVVKATTPKTLEGKQTKVECFITEIAESCPVRFGRKPVSGLGGMLVPSRWGRGGVVGGGGARGQ